MARETFMCLCVCLLNIEYVCMYVDLTLGAQRFNLQFGLHWLWYGSVCAMFICYAYVFMCYVLFLLRTLRECMDPVHWYCTLNRICLLVCLPRRHVDIVFVRICLFRHKNWMRTHYLHTFWDAVLCASNKHTHKSSHGPHKFSFVFSGSWMLKLARHKWV